jgi:hypothetical protein
MGLIGFAAFASDDVINATPIMMSDNMLMADNPRKGRRDNRQGDRQGDRDDKQHCRQEEGRVGDDKRDCKQEKRGEDNDGTESEPKSEA